MQEKVEKCRKEVEVTCERYKQSLDELNASTAKYVEDMTEVYHRTQQLERRRLEFIKKIFYDMHSRLDLTQIQEYACFLLLVASNIAQSLLRW